MPSIVYSNKLSKETCDEVLRRFHKFNKEGVPENLFKNKVVGTLAFQPSTRTMNIFQSAMIRGGGGWIGINDVNNTSMAKGESLEDTVRDISAMVDIIVSRHSDNDAAERIEESSFVPTINGGSGSKEHGVAGLMMLCYLEYFMNKSLQDSKIGFYGTVEINRVSKAIIPLLGYYNVELTIDDLGHFPLPEEVQKKAEDNGLKSCKYDNLDNFISEVDALILTRGLQKGIIPEGKFSKEKEEMVLQKYKPIGKEEMEKLRQDAILVMLKPRIFEVKPEVDSDPRATYSKQEPWMTSAAATLSYCLDISV